jgi:Domain of unknown function (DUF4157)/Novel toxin 15
MSSKKSQIAPKTAPSKGHTAVQAKSQAAISQRVGAVGRPAVWQAKVAVGSPDDAYERQADSVADRVLRMPAAVPSAVSQASPRGVQMKSVWGDISPYVAAKTLPEKEKLQKKIDEKEPKIQRKENGGGFLNSSVESSLHQSKTGGSALSDDTRSYMEPRFGADFSQVKIHTDASAVQMNKQLGARAFTHGQHIYFNDSQYQPQSDSGKWLLAHELTHVVQQGGAVQRKMEVSSTPAPMVQKLGISDALDYFADKANLIPGFRMFTIVLGLNPINMSRVERSAANILRAIIEFLPGGGFITQALDNHGVFDKVGAWVEKQFAQFSNLGASIKKSITDFLDSLGWRDIFDLGGVWSRAKRLLSDPVDRLISFGKNLVSGIVNLVKTAILKPLAQFVKSQTNAYDLLCAVLGYDPISGDPVPSTADALIGGFMKLIGQEEIWQNIKKANAIPRAFAWFKGALAGLLGLVRQIPKLALDTFRSLTIEDIVIIPKAFLKIGRAFAGFVGQFISWAGQTIWDLLEIIFAVLAPSVLVYLKKAKSAFKTILKNPIGFIGNLVRAGKLGFQKFANNIGNHLKAALINWLVGPLAEAGVYIPQSFSLMEIIKLVLSVLGLTWQNIRTKLLKIIPEPVLTVLEKSAGILLTLVTQGPAAAWEQIKSELEELKGQLISQVVQMVTSQIVQAAVTKLVMMLNPAGAFIQAIMAIYNTVTFFIQRLQQIGQVVASFIDSISAIASGQVEGAAARVEATMARGLTLVIAFLAKFAGLGGIPAKLVGIVQKIRQPIDRGLDKIVAWLGKMLEKMKTAVKNLFFKPKTFQAGGESHRLYAQDGEVMMASSPARLNKALGNFRNKDPKPSADTLKLIGQADTKGSKLQKNLDKKDDSLIPENETLSTDIVALVVKIMYDTGGPKKKEMPKATVTFEAKGDKTEFSRQIGMQQATLNNMKVGAWTQNRARFVAFGRDDKNDTDTARRTALTQSLINNPVEAIQSLKNHGLLQPYDVNEINRILSDASITDKNKALRPIAVSIMSSYGSKKLAVLHTVDQVAGGSATTYGDKEGIFGSTSVNSEIGRQWKDKIKEVDVKAKDVEPEANVNVKLKS